MVIRSLELVLLTAVIFSCTEQHQPEKDWAMFDREQANADKPTPLLTADGKIPERLTADAGNEDPTEKQYKNFCSSCHGLTGEGDGPAGTSMKPPPRNFVTWEDVPLARIEKVLIEGGEKNNLSANMAAWGGVMTPDEIALMAKKVKAFRK
jgi:mono/diheme cytochrome c family protein